MPLALISMALSPAEAKAETMLPEPDDLPKYPWGLQLDLNDDVLKKLGLTELPATGTTLILSAKVEVVSTSESERQGEICRCLGLQVTDMQLDAAPLARKDNTDVFYGTGAA